MCLCHLTCILCTMNFLLHFLRPPLPSFSLILLLILLLILFHLSFVSFNFSSPFFSGFLVLIFSSFIFSLFLLYFLSYIPSHSFLYTLLFKRLLRSLKRFPFLNYSTDIVMYRCLSICMLHLSFTSNSNFLGFKIEDRKSF